MAWRELFRWILVATLFATPGYAHAQVKDTLSTASQRAPSHSPTGALWRSAVLPGLGQIYNHQPIKTPIIVAVLGGLTWLAVHNDSQFNLYNHAYLYGAYISEDPHPYPQYEADYLRFPGVSTAALRVRRDAFKRDRDLSIIGIVAAYGLNLLDAYVNGQLYYFDVGEDLSSLDGGGPPTLAMRLRLRF